MKNFIILTESINFIEQNLCEPITRKDIAKHCFISLSSLEKLFHYALEISIKEYISKRRMTQAAKDILKNDMNISDIAMKYQYNSLEVFSRAFKRLWNTNPSEFKEKWNFTGIFPKINYEYQEGEDLYMARKKVDISEAYEFFKELKGSYVICFDGKHFSQINEISFKAGDLAILEIASRIDKVASDDMVVLRIGGDEFALITGIYDESEVKMIANTVLQENGNPIIFEGKEIPISLWYGMIVIPEELKYDELFESMHLAISHLKTSTID